MTFNFYREKITVEQKDNVCEKCGSIYEIYADATTYDHGPSLECTQCSRVVVFSMSNVPNGQELEKKFGIAETKKILEKQFPPCPSCSGKLVFSDLFISGFPRKCSHCGFVNEKMSQKIHNASEAKLIEKEMVLLGYDQSEKTKS